jgi:hypothetical protein
LLPGARAATISKFACWPNTAEYESGAARRQYCFDAFGAGNSTRSRAGECRDARTVRQSRQPFRFLIDAAGGKNGRHGEGVVGQEWRRMQRAAHLLLHDGDFDLAQA